MALVGVALLVAPRGFPGRWLGLFWLLPALIWMPPRPGFGELWLTQVDVGQGLSVIVRTRSHVLVFDAGPRHSARFDAGRAYVTPVLRHHGVERIDRLVVSHDHNDHAGGTEGLLAEWPVGEVVSAQPLAIGPVRACRAGEHWEWDGVRFQWLHPDEGVWRGNDEACVLMITGAHGRALLPGDISRRAERSLVARYGPQLRADVIVVPHHGSRSSSSEAFLDQVAPRLALLSVGYRNRYRHPHPDVMARYRERAIPVPDSATQGAIEVRLTAAGPVWEGWRERAGRFWHAH
jgi:competence protein ComEC